MYNYNKKIRNINIDKTDSITTNYIIKKYKEGKGFMDKIIFGITGLTMGGAERVLIDTANALVDKYDITIFTIYSKGELEKELKSNIQLISLYDFKYSEMSKIKNPYATKSIND